MSTVADAFLDHLVLTLSNLETNEYYLLGNLNYTGPTDWRTDAITRGLETMRKRRVAEFDTTKVLPSSITLSEDDFELDNEWVLVSKDEVTEMETTLSPSNATSSLEDTRSQSQQTSVSLVSLEDYQVNAAPCSDEASPIVLPPFFPPFPSTPDTLQELRLLKAQVSDFVRVCNAVSRGDFTQRLYGWADSIVMEQFRVTVNGMVGLLRQIDASPLINVFEKIGRSSRIFLE